jgi:hypothetical protein
MQGLLPAITPLNIAIYIGLSLLLGIWGRHTRLHFWGVFLLSLYLTPLIVFVAVLFLSPPRHHVFEDYLADVPSTKP